MGLGNDFLDGVSKAHPTKAKINKWEAMEPQSFCPAEETTNSNEKNRQPTEPEETFANRVRV